MRYISYYTISILVLEQLRKENLIQVFDKQKLNKALKEYFIKHKEELLKLK